MNGRTKVSSKDARQLRKTKTQTKNDGPLRRTLEHDEKRKTEEETDTTKRRQNETTRKRKRRKTNADDETKKGKTGSQRERRRWTKTNYGIGNERSNSYTNEKCAATGNSVNDTDAPPRVLARRPKHRAPSPVRDKRSATHENTTRSLVKCTNEREIDVSKRQLNGADYTQRLLDDA